MSKFIDLTIKPVLIIGGAGTSLAGLNAFFPQFAVEKIQQLEFIPDYTIFVQHWGIMVGLFGVLMVAAAFKESWRVPVILYGMLEKGFMVYLYVSNRSETFANGFIVPAVVDGVITLWSVMYFVSLRAESGREEK